MRIVVVDPSRTVLKIVAGLLQNRNREVHPFSDGPEAFAYIKANAEVDALITSVELPSMSGIELCRQTRLLAIRGRSIYIMLMSSNYEQGKLIEALDSGADDFIGKPPATEELYARLRAAKRLRDMQRELVRLATTDCLSGTLNRRAFFEQAEESCARAIEAGPLSAIMFDIDNFKCVNDEHGHDVGDRVIRAVAHAALDEREPVGRLGGEEFAILLRGRPLAAGAAFAERMRHTIAALDLAASGKPIRITTSFGVAEWEQGETIDALLKRADIALYQAKVAGRNRVVAAEGPPVMRHQGGLVRAAAR
jgi:diguanylate cyclase (GGDEF)-like protein